MTADAYFLLFFCPPFFCQTLSLPVFFHSTYSSHSWFLVLWFRPQAALGFIRGIASPSVGMISWFIPTLVATASRARFTSATLGICVRRVGVRASACCG